MFRPAPKPVVDLHVHVAAREAPGCRFDGRMWGQPGFLAMLALNRMSPLALAGDFDGAVRRHVLGHLRAAETVDRGVLLAMDWVYRGGRRDRRRSHYVVSNAYVRDLAAAHREVLFGASIHPARGIAEAAAELKRCLDPAGGPPAALVKWLPNSQCIDPSGDCDGFFELLAAEGVPLLCHTGTEHTIPAPHQEWGDPRLLRRALDCGVRVIAAHCAAKAYAWQRKGDHLADLLAMLREAERRNWRWDLYADLSAMCVPSRIARIAPDVRDRLAPFADRLVLGSDYPVPIANRLPIRNPFDRHHRQLLELGFPAAVGTRAAEVLNPKALAWPSPAGA